MPWMLFLTPFGLYAELSGLIKPKYLQVLPLSHKVMGVHAIDSLILASLALSDVKTI